LADVYFYLTVVAFLAGFVQGLSGFGSVLLPAGNLAALDKRDLPEIECLGVRTVREALQKVF